MFSQRLARAGGGGRGESDDSRPVKLHFCQVLSPRGGHYGAGESVCLWGGSASRRPGSPEGSISPAVKEQGSLEAPSCLPALDTRHSLHLDYAPIPEELQQQRHDNLAELSRRPGGADFCPRRFSFQHVKQLFRLKRVFVWIIFPLKCFYFLLISEMSSHPEHPACFLAYVNYGFYLWAYTYVQISIKICTFARIYIFGTRRRAFSDSEWFKWVSSKEVIGC